MNLGTEYFMAKSNWKGSSLRKNSSTDYICSRSFFFFFSRTPLGFMIDNVILLINEWINLILLFNWALSSYWAKYWALLNHMNEWKVYSQNSGSFHSLASEFNSVIKATNKNNSSYKKLLWRNWEQTDGRSGKNKINWKRLSGGGKSWDRSIHPYFFKAPLSHFPALLP